MAQLTAASSAVAWDGIIFLLECRRCFYQCFIIIHVFLILHTNGLTLSGERKGTAVPRFPNQSPTTKLHSSEPKKKRKQAHQSQQAHPTTPQAHYQTNHRITQKVTQRIPTTIRIQSMAEFLKSITGHRVDTPSSQHQHLSSFCLPLLWSPCSYLPSSCLLTFHILPQPTAQEILFMHGLVLSDNVSFFLWQCTSVLQHFHSGEIPWTFCAMNPPISKSFHNLLYSFLVILLFVLRSSSSLLPWQGSCRLQGPEFVLTSCRTLLCPLAPACSNSSILVPFSVSHGPSIFCTKSEFHPACPILLTK